MSSKGSKKNKKAKAKAEVKFLSKALTGHGSYESVKKKNKQRSANKVAKQLAATMSAPQSGFKGHGDYLGDLLGGWGNKLGNWLSGKAMGLLGGSGDYGDETVHVNAEKPVENSMLNGSAVPTIKNKGQAFIFRHKEYISDVSPSVNFTLQNYLINPGNGNLFPWLQSQAISYEEYQILGMIAEYVPEIGSASVNSQGSVMISTEYNAVKANFSSKAQMLNQEYAVSCAPQHGMMHAIECAKSETTFPHRYVLNGTAVPGTEDPKTYFWGNLQVATQGQANTTGKIGELWVTYEIACFKPIIGAANVQATWPTDKYKINSTSIAATNLAAGLGSLLPNSCSNIGTHMTTDGYLHFPTTTNGKTYLVNVNAYNVGAWSTGVTYMSPPSPADGVIPSVYLNNTSGNVGNVLVNTNTGLIMSDFAFTPNLTAVDPRVQILQVNAAETGNLMIDIFVSEVCPNYS